MSIDIGDKNYYLASSIFPGIGPKKFDLLLRKFGSAENAWKASNSGGSYMITNY